MIATILSALVVGLIVGALARLIMPGKQNIGVIMTIIAWRARLVHRGLGDLPTGLPQRQRRMAGHPVPRRGHRGDRPDRDLRRHHRPARHGSTPTVR